MASLPLDDSARFFDGTESVDPKSAANSSGKLFHELKDEVLLQGSDLTDAFMAFV